MADGSVLTVVRSAWRDVLASGVADYRATYTVRSWTFGWLVRLVAQVTYFGLLGVLARDPRATGEIVLGNVVLLTSVSTLFAVSAIARERRFGTIDSLLLARVPLAVSLGLRNLVWVADGMATALLALGFASALFDLRFPWQTYLLAVPACALAGVATLGVALVAGTLVLDHPSVRSLLAGIITAALAVLGGVNYPVPPAVSVPLRVLPVTDPILVLKRSAYGGDWLVELGIAAVVAVAWLVAAVVTVDRWTSRTRSAPVRR